MFWKYAGTQLWQSVISIKLQTVACSFNGITLQHRCSPVNLLYIFRTLFPKNTSGGLLWKNLKQNHQNMSFLLLSLSLLIVWVIIQFFIYNFIFQDLFKLGKLLSKLLTDHLLLKYFKKSKAKIPEPFSFR